MCVHLSGEVDSFNAHCSAFIAVLHAKFDGKLRTIFKVVAKNIGLFFEDMMYS